MATVLQIFVVITDQKLLILLYNMSIPVQMFSK